MENKTECTFADFNLKPELYKSLEESGYTTPSPIQEKMIPHMMNGSDVIGQAQTGTGKTAAFALPLLSTISLEKKYPQVLVLAPTRELALQVSESFKKYAKHMRGFNIVSIYGGQGYPEQLRALKKGAHIVVGTPGRVIDHMKRGTLQLERLTSFVLDEADEMLRMGFIDDVELILESAPKERQVALFSATMPKEIRRIANKYLTNPQEIVIKGKESNQPKINQRFWVAKGMNKLDALTRILEEKTSEGVIVFVRTKNQTHELADALVERGFSSAALNGDIAQKQRETTIDQLKSGKISILVATDVAARGLDVDRISHVINYDIPFDTESYVHRIGRTGRAGRKGEAILFVAPREMRMLSNIERATNLPIEEMNVPTIKDINAIRIASFKSQISAAIESKESAFYKKLLTEYIEETGSDALDVAAAISCMMQKGSSLLLDPSRDSQRPIVESRGGDRRDRYDRSSDRGGERGERSNSRGGRERSFSRGDNDRFSGRGRSSAGPSRDRKPSRSRKSR